MSNSSWVIGVERRLGLFSERSLQDLVLRSRSVVELLDYYYVFVHFSASFGFMVWAFTRHPEMWSRIRWWFLSVTVAGLAIHVAFPLAPPRMQTQHGFVDTLHLYGPSIYSRDVTNSAANQLAAMPSLHFGWAVIVAAGFIAIKRTRTSWLIVLHPIVTLLAIVATANHYWMDAIVAGVLVALAVVATSARRDRVMVSSSRASRLVATVPVTESSAWRGMPADRSSRRPSAPHRHPCRSACRTCPATCRGPSSRPCRDRLSAACSSPSQPS
ncbi:MAG: phosphatase PAP2 family protein [Acidimicrobiia bacterium]